VHRRTFSTGRSFTISQLYKSRFPEEKTFEICKKDSKPKSADTVQAKYLAGNANRAYLSENRNCHN
jgi:hypothetical protein